jgi:hypothetical protein
MVLTCSYGESAGRVAQLAAIERGPVQLDAVGIVAVLQVCSTLIGERSSTAGLRALVLRLVQGGCAWRSARLCSGARPSRWVTAIMMFICPSALPSERR